jgi:hypothetical protein
MHTLHCPRTAQLKPLPRLQLQRSSSNVQLQGGCATAGSRHTAVSCQQQQQHINKPDTVLAVPEHGRADNDQQSKALPNKGQP